MHWAHDLLAYYHWAVISGLWRDVIAGLIGYVLAHLVAWRPKKRLERIEHLLDTEKPGGLTDVVQALKENKTDG